MKKLSIIAICLVASILVACGGGSGSGSGEKYDLYYKLEPGKTYGQKINMDMKMTATVMGQSMDMEMSMTMDMDITVVDTAENIVCDAKFNNVSMGISSPMGNVSFSSDDDPNYNPAVKMLKAMTDIDFAITMTKYGEVKSMTGFESMIDKMQEAGLSEAEIAQTRAMIEQSFSEDKMVEQMQNMSIYPKHPVAIGDSWTMDINTAQMEMENTYTLKKVTDSEIILDMESKVKNMTIDGFTGSIEGIQNGTTTVHRSSGWIKESKIKQDIKGSGRMQGMESKITLKSDITVKE